jgi:hypothetical protein
LKRSFRSTQVDAAFHPRPAPAQRPCLGCCSVAGLLLLGVPATSAQGPTDAAIRGRVTGICPPSIQLCAARIHLNSTGSAGPAVERDIHTDNSGYFLLQRLLRGDYELRADSNWSLQPTAAVTVTLQPGAITDVSLSLARQAKHPPVATFVDSTGLRDITADLPTEEARWENLAELDSQESAAARVPQTASGPEDDDPDDPSTSVSASDGAAAAGLSYAGIAPIEGAATLDGLSAEQNFRAGPRGSSTGGPSSGSSFSQGAVHSFRILPHSFSAQYGGAGGGLAVVSRWGGNRLHGSAFVLSRLSSLAAANPFSIETHYRDGIITSAAVKPSGSLEQLGAQAGLPLSSLTTHRVKTATPAALRQTWIFASVEAQWHGDHIVSSPATASFYDLSAEQTTLLANRGVGAPATNAALNYLDSLTGTTARSAYRLQAFGRVEAQLDHSDRVAVSYAANRFSSPAGVALGQASDAVVARGRGSLGDSEVQVDAVAARWLRTFSSRWNNELRGQLSRDLEYETPLAPLAQEPAIGPGGFAPQVTIGPNGFAYGTPSNLAWSAAGGRRAYPDEARIELADSTQLRLGRHLLTLGGDWSRIHDRIDALNNAEGSFNYDSGTTNGKDGGLVDWITDYTFNVNAYPNGGCPSIVAPVHDFCFHSFTQSFAPTLDAAQTQFATHTVAGFVEDAVRLAGSLSVTLGVRYEYTLLPLPQTANASLDAGIATLSLPIHGATGTIPEDRNNFGPRVSTAWSPHLKSSRWTDSDGALFTMRLGYGLFFGRIPGATVRAALTDTALPSTTLRVRIRPTTETLCPQVTALQQGFGYPCDYTAAPPAAVAQTTSAVVFASNYRVPSVQRTSFTLERQLARRTLLRFSYQNAMATQLPGSTDINIAPSPGYGSFILQGGQGHAGLHNGQTFVVPVYSQRLLTTYGPITALVSHSNATYHAATIELDTHGSALAGPHSLELRASYTFSRAIDYGPQSSATPATDGQFDPYRDGYDKGLSNQHFPQRFTGDLIYRTDFPWGPKPLRQTLQGWRFAAIGIAGSGPPYSYKIFGGPYLSGGRESINGSGGATYLPTIGRNTLRLPPRGRLDLRLSRDFAVPLTLAGTRARLNIFAAAFNLLNTVNLASVDTRAFLLGTPPTTGGNPGPTPLIFQDAATIASEGLTTTPAFGTPTSSTTGISRERQVEIGLRLQF